MTDDPGMRYGLTDDITTCPKCGSRTDFEETGKPDGEQAHTCLSPHCGYKFLGFFDPEDFDADGNFIDTEEGSMTPNEWLNKASERRAHYEEQEALASVLVLATMVREGFGTRITGIKLEDSDQGPYAIVQGLVDAEGNDLDESDGEDVEQLLDEMQSYASYLEDRTFAYYAPFCRDGAYIGKRSGITDTVIDIEKALAIEVPA